MGIQVASKSASELANRTYNAHDRPLYDAAHAMNASVAAIRHHYDTFAHIYPRFWGEHIHHGLFVRGDEQPADAQIAMLDHCFALLQPRKEALVLDVGCGHGGTAIYIATARNWCVHGMTIS